MACAILARVSPIFARSPLAITVLSPCPDGDKTTLTDKAVYAKVLLILTMQIHELCDWAERLSTNQAANGLKHLKRLW